ncbi:glycosyltransferase [Pseudovibrio flavus]|uniref:glycosyltransferase n=1 Tax=Pseudovibrio flavus TaxID=2529854 RepID=UPI00211B7AE0|nr:glycosyltransferase [Pseudovibrio flavus]
MGTKQVHIVQKMAPGGIELLVRRLADEDGVDVHIYSLESPDGPVEGEANTANDWLTSSKVTIFNKKAGLRPDLIWHLIGELKKQKPDVVVTHHIGPLLYGGAAARLAGVPVFAHIEHDAWHLEDDNQRRLTKLACKVLKPKLAGVSTTVAKRVGELTGRADVAVIPNGIDIQKFRPADKAEARRAFGLPDEGVVVGAVGRLEMVKGFDVLVAAAAHLPPNYTVVIAGDGSQKEALSRQISQLGLEGRVRLLGSVEHMERLFPAFDVLAVPSRNEGLPLTIIEAQSCSVPVVASRVGAVPDGLCPQTSRLVEPEDPSLLAKAIMERIEAPLEIDPRDFVISQFDWSKTTSAYTALAAEEHHGS